jgi:hypothetical protein
LELLLQPPCVVTGYRPSHLLSSALLRHGSTAASAIPASVHQSAFDFKPWVESELLKAGVGGLGWKYDQPGSFELARHLVNDGPVMVRAARTSGGVGLVAIRDQAELTRLEATAGWGMTSHVAGGLTAVAPLLEGLVPVNVGAVIYRDDIRLHPASVQLIGVPGATTRPFGYCGNDFVATTGLGSKTLERLEKMTTTVGWWLHRYGLRGAFGVDFLVDEHRVLFTEVNPRLQGSTALSSRIAVEAGQSCVVLEHLAAGLGLAPCGSSRSLSWWAERSDYAQLVVHAAGPGPVRMSPAARVGELTQAGAVAYADLCTNADLLTDEGAALCRLTVRGQITMSGFELLPGQDQLLGGWLPEGVPA